MAKHWVDYATAFGTIGAAFAAAAAALYGSQQANTARDSAERQFRAYINVVARNEGLTNTENPLRAELSLNNTGETPAFNLEMSTGCQIYPVDKLEIDFPLLAPDDMRLVVPGHAVGSQFLNVYCSRLTDDQRSDFVRRKNKLIFWGTVFYTDTFNKPHYTQFCYKVMHKESREGSDWAQCEAHQMAD